MAKKARVLSVDGGGIRGIIPAVILSELEKAMGKPIASVCHGVEIPAAADCVRGRRMATVAKCRFDLEVCGGVFVDEPCVVDGNLVSGRTYHDHGQYMGVWMKMLNAARAAGS